MGVQVILFTVLYFKLSVKVNYLYYLKHFFIRNNYNFCKFSYNSQILSLFLFFRRNKDQVSIFQQVGGLVTRHISVFCL